MFDPSAPEGRVIVFPSFIRLPARFGEEPFGSVTILRRHPEHKSGGSWSRSMRIVFLICLCTLPLITVGCGSGGGETGSAASQSELDEYLQENPSPTEEETYEVE